MSAVVQTRLDVMATCKEVAKRHEQLKRAEREIGCAYTAIMNEVAPIYYEDFWPLIDVLNKEIKRLGSHRLGVESFVHNAAFGHTSYYPLGSTKKVYTTMDMTMGFVKRYEQICEDLYKPLFDVIEGFGDDGYGDILDSFPLHGRQRVEMGLKGEIDGTSEDQYQGENYVRMNLNDTLTKKFAMKCYHDHRNELHEDAES